MITIDNSLQQQIQKQREKELFQKKRNEETKRERDIEKERESVSNMGAERSENRKRTMSNTHVKPRKSLTHSRRDYFY
jgi:hypothetical protein